MSSPDVMSSPRALPDRRSRRRDSRPTSRNISSPYYRQPSTSSTTSFFPNFAWPSTDFVNLHSSGQAANFDVFNSFEVISPTQPDISEDSIIPNEEGWVTVAPHSPSSVWSGSALLEQFLAQNRSGPQSPMSSKISVSSPSWDNLTSNRSRVDTNTQNIGHENLSIAHGSLGSEGLATPNTFNSSASDGFPLPGSSPGHVSPLRGGTDLLQDMVLPDDFWNHGYPHLIPTPYGTQDALVSPNQSFDVNITGGQFDWDCDPQLIFGSDTLSPSNFIMQQPHDVQYPQTHLDRSDLPWNSQGAQFDSFSADVSAGATNAGQAGRPSHGTQHGRDGFLLDQQQAFLPTFGPNPVASANEPTEEPMNRGSASDSPASQESFAHSHVFSANPATEILDTQRGRKRRLTEEEREHTLKVRTAGACWACHLSKTRCSPCRPGSPCEQCTRLLNKRRFYHLSCFNEPIETLNTFLIPDYLVGHLTSSNVDKFMISNVSAWGSYSIDVRMIWGCGQPIEVTVENLFFRNMQSPIAHVEQAIVDESGRAKLMSLACPPLGLTAAAAIKDLKQGFRDYLRSLVKNDLGDYASNAYDEPDSEVPRRLLKAACEWYVAGMESGKECQILRSTLEIHITCTMLERSFRLDDESFDRVQEILNQRFPPEAAPKCAQRQMKLVLFSLQRQRIVDVLQKWGKMMHSSANTENKWEIAFCVFLLLTLIMDKTIAAAHTFCEQKIQYQGFAEQDQKALFHKLVRLMQREFFERCKEIFHSRFKTRRNGRESCNPIRDSLGAWRGKEQPEFRTIQLIGDIQRVMRDFGIGEFAGGSLTLAVDVVADIGAGRETKPSAQSSKLGEPGGEGQAYHVGDDVYANLGRLATIFLCDFR